MSVIRGGIAGGGGAGGGPVALHTGYRSGLWYSHAQGPVANNGQIFGANQLHAYGLRIYREVSVNALGCRLAGTAAGGLMRLGIYASDPQTNRPGALLASTPSLPLDIAGDISGAVAVTLSPGVVWATCLASASVSVFSIQTTLDLDFLGTTSIAQAVGYNLAAGPAVIYQAGLAYGSLPATCPPGGVAIANVVPLIVFRAA